LSRFLSRFSPIHPLGTALRESLSLTLDKIVPDRAVAFSDCDGPVSENCLERSK